MILELYRYKEEITCIEKLMKKYINCMMNL